MDIQAELDKLAEEGNPVSPQASLSMSNEAAPMSVAITVLTPNGFYITAYGSTPKEAFLEARARIFILKAGEAA
jgi:hypothetical protein